jgi:starch-binding outer membrane protein, SusD/RagB family
MKHRTSRIGRFGLALLAAAVMGCDSDEFLTDVGLPSQGISQFGSTADLEAAINGAYWAMATAEGFRGIHGNYQILDGFASDEGRLHNDIGVVDADVTEWYARRFGDNTANWTGRFWYAAYSTIRVVNEVIHHIETRGPFQDTQAGWTDRILGEAYFVRAFGHTVLQNAYGVPWGAVAGNGEPSIPLQARLQANPFDNPPRSTTAEVYALIRSDLERAVALMPDRFSASRDSDGFRVRGDRMAAHFLLYRTHFAMGNWQAAEQQIDIILSTGRFPLNQAPIEAWNKDVVGQAGTEVVWQYFTNSPQTQFKPPILARYFGFAGPNGGFMRNCNPTTRCNNSQDVSVADSVLQRIGWGTPQERAADRRFQQLYVEHTQTSEPRTVYRTTYASPTDTRVWPNKWYRSPGGGTADAQGQVNANARQSSLPLMRSAELFLSRSYLRFRRGDTGGARADLDVVRTRAGIGPFTGTLTEEVIHNERLKEMLFEGDRVWYLRALQMNIPNGDRAADQGRVAGGFDWRLVRLPVPQAELDLNPNL